MDHIQQDIHADGYLVNQNCTEFESDEEDDVYMDTSSQNDIHQIEAIDAKGYLVPSNVSEFESDNGIDLDAEHGTENENGNDVLILGKLFDTPDDAYTFYNRYAFTQGFGIRKRVTFKNKTRNEPYRKKFVCNKEGFKSVTGKSSSDNVKKPRRILRTGCPEYLRISKTKDGKWVVDAFIDKHNHELSTPSKVMKHRSHGKFHRSMACKSLMSELGQSGLRPCQIKKVINTMKDPLEADVTSKQCADILSEQRKQYKGKEFYGVIKHFQDKASVDSKLYWVVDLFEDGSPRNIFWADGRSRDAYINFGDVLVFDVTYMTNRFRMPFSPFVDVNHHGQSILFAGALLENEKEETFVQSLPIKIKLLEMQSKEFFQNRVIVIVHGTFRELVHLQPIISLYNEFKVVYKRWLKSDSIKEFEAQWEVIHNEYKLENHYWLNDMYAQRSLWVKAFLKDCFFAGMTTSGRSESIHSYFDGFVNSNTMLNEFVVQYDKAVDARRKAEEDQDFKTMNSKAVLSSVNPIEAKACTRYTSNMFEVFQKEWTQATNNLAHETLCKSAEEIKYKVGQLDVERKYWRIVNFHDSHNVYATCSCSKFETYGLLCKHILYVFKKRHVNTLPDHYILPRWTLDSRHRVDKCIIGIDDRQCENGVSALTLWCIQAKYTKAIEQARDSPSEINKLDGLLTKFLEEQAIRTKPKEVEHESQQSITRNSEVNIMPQICIRDPQAVTTTKGRPKSATRIKSSLEAPEKKHVLIARDWAEDSLLGQDATSFKNR